MSVSLKFLGAAGGVTGSRTLVEFNGRKILIDCGLFQGPKEIRAKNRERLLTPDLKIDAVVLTHAHLDHSGFLPRLHREGYRGPIFCSEGTFDLLPIMLMDAAHLEEETARYANLSGYSSHKPAVPLFTQSDVEAVLKLLSPVPRHQWKELAPGMSMQFLHAGHIIGASMVQLAISYENRHKLLTFSGDLGHSRMKTLRAPEALVETDVLVLESTYGDRLHPRSDSIQELAAVANRTFARGGTLVIPAFAVGRSQEILYLIRLCEDQGLIPKVRVILDSPMSSAVTRTFFQHPEDHNEWIASRGTATDETYLPAHMTTSATPDDSLLACMQEGPGIVISAAGMLNGGRILHHLKARLPHEENTILFCGYQAEGTKGRFLQDNADQLETLRIHHTPVEIKAEIATMASLSAHGDWQDLCEWLAQMQKLPQKIILNHGDPDAMTGFIPRLKQLSSQTEVIAMKDPGILDLF